MATLTLLSCKTEPELKERLDGLLRIMAEEIAQGRSLSNLFKRSDEQFKQSLYLGNYPVSEQLQEEYGKRYEQEIAAKINLKDLTKQSRRRRNKLE